MRSTTALVVAALTVTGGASALALAGGGGISFGSDWDHGSHHAGPDSARVEAFLGALHATAPMVCEMVTDQLGNFWSSEGDDGLGSLADASRNWEPARDSLSSPVNDAAARRRLARALGDEDPCVRRAAAKMLGRSGVLAAAALHEALRASAPRVREAALLALGHAELPDFYDEIVSATRDNDPAVVAMATWALGELERPAAIGRLGELVSSREVRVRRAAAWGIGQLEDPRGVALVEPLLRDGDVTTRVVAAEALGDIESATAAPALAAALKDADLRVRCAAARALGELDDLERAPQELIDALGSGDLSLRHAAAEAAPCRSVGADARGRSWRWRRAPRSRRRTS